MSVRVVARVRPLLKSEREMDVIVRANGSPSQYNIEPSMAGVNNAKTLDATLQSSRTKRDIRDDKPLTLCKERGVTVRIPNPKNESEEFAFRFNAVYDGNSSQAEIFEAEGCFYRLLR
jgi:protein transport protein SEC24